MSKFPKEVHEELWKLLEPLSWFDAIAALGEAGADEEMIRSYHEKWEHRRLYGTPDPQGREPIGILSALA